MADIHRSNGNDTEDGMNGFKSLACGLIFLLLACSEQGPSEPSPSGGQVATAGAAPKVSFYAASRFAEQASFGPTPALVAELQAKGFERWIDEQLAAPRTELNTNRFLDWNLNQDQDGSRRKFGGEVGRVFISAPDQLHWRVTWSLSQFIVVSAQRLDAGPTGIWVNHLHSLALGSYGDLLRGISTSAPMGFYLDNAQNRPKGDDCPTCVPNENYARELMQLFTIGVVKLNADGTVVRNNRGAPLESYTQRDVEELARVLTGWRFNPVHEPDTPRNWGSWNKPMLASTYSNDRDSGRKLVLGRTFAAGQSINKDLDDMVALLMQHPNIAPFVSLRMIQQLVKSDPTPAYVARISTVFRDNGRGVAGDMKALVKAILLDVEARRGDDPAQASSTEGKLREPMLQFAALLRGLACREPPVQPWNNEPMRSHEQEAYHPLSVFSFYAATDRAPGSNLLAPEHKLLTSNTFRTRLDDLHYLLVYEGGSKGRQALLDAGCRVDEFVAAYRQSLGALMQLVGQRYMRGVPPAQLSTVLAPVNSKWRNNALPDDEITVRLIEMALMSDAFGAMR